MTNTGQSIRAWWFKHEGKHYAIPTEQLNSWENAFGERFWNEGIVPENLDEYEKSIEGLVIIIDGECMIWEDGEFIPYVEGVKIYEE